MFQAVIEQIEHAQRRRRLAISIDQGTDETVLAKNSPPKRCAGLYFFYTSYTTEELKNAGSPPGERAVPIAELATTFEGLRGLPQVEQDGFRLVYNGRGGYSGSDYDLRARILQEISADPDTTGSLCIRQSGVNDLARWRYSYVILSSQMSSVQPDIIGPWTYERHSRELERYWRLDRGWPLLSLAELRL